MEMDSAGRINFPKNMLAHAGIENEAMVIGMGNYIEIWNPTVFEEHEVSDAEEYSALAQKYLDSE